MTWAEVLGELHAGLAGASDDIWYSLTAVGMTEHSLDEAREATDLVAAYVPNLHACRVADLGCGVGRHLAPLARRTGELVGVEASASLAGLASQLAPSARVEVASFHDLAEFGAFDVVCAFSHILMLTEGPEGVVGNLQLLRGAMPDYGLLVVEVMPVSAGRVEWSGVVDGTTIVEERLATPTGLRHEFRVKSTEGEMLSEVPSARVAPSAWPDVAEAGGFQVEKVEPFLYSDGTSSTFYFLRAQKGYNFLSDLGEFLESWAQPEHPRNRRGVEWAADSSERRRPVGALALGQGASLSKHHPDFSDALEPRIRPLVLEFAKHWHYVTYSSCGGHLVRSEPAEVYSEAYCGVVTFSNRQLSMISHLVESATREFRSAEVEVDVRTRALHGSGTVLTAADVLFRRRGTDVPWSDYADGVRRAVEAMCGRLNELRERP